MEELQFLCIPSLKSFQPIVTKLSPRQDHQDIAADQSNPYISPRRHKKSIKNLGYWWMYIITFLCFLILYQLASNKTQTLLNRKGKHKYHTTICINHLEKVGHSAYLRYYCCHLKLSSVFIYFWMITEPSFSIQCNEQNERIHILSLFNK